MLLNAEGSQSLGRSASSLRFLCGLACVGRGGVFRGDRARSKPPKTTRALAVTFLKQSTGRAGSAVPPGPNGWCDAERECDGDAFRFQTAASASASKLVSRGRGVLVGRMVTLGHQS